MWVGGPVQLLPDTVPSLLRLPQPLLPMGNSHKQGVACDERQERHRSCEADVPLLLVSMEQRVKGSSDTGAGHNEHTHKHTVGHFRPPNCAVKFEVPDDFDEFVQLKNL